MEKVLQLYKIFDLEFFSITPKHGKRWLQILCVLVCPSVDKPPKLPNWQLSFKSGALHQIGRDLVFFLPLKIKSSSHKK